MINFKQNKNIIDQLIFIEDTRFYKIFNEMYFSQEKALKDF